MKNRQILIPLTVIIAIVSLGVLIPNALSSPETVHDAFATLPPTQTPTPLPQQIRGDVELLSSREAATPTPGVMTNCTYNVYYWKYRQSVWPQQIAFGGKSYTPETMLRILAEPEPDISTILTIELYVTFLNILRGAASEGIQADILSASQWLVENPAGEPMSEFQKQVGTEYILILRAYNEGITGPGPCPGQPPTPTPAPGTAVLAPQNTQPPVIEPTATSTQRTYIYPTLTHTPLPSGPREPRDTATPAPLPPTDPPPPPPPTDPPVIILPTETPLPIPTVAPEG